MTEVGLEVIAVSRMHKYSDLQLVLAQLSNTALKIIFNLITLGHLLIKVEPQETRTPIPQCHR